MALGVSKAREMRTLLRPRTGALPDDRSTERPVVKIFRVQVARRVVESRRCELPIVFVVRLVEWGFAEQPLFLPRA
jgi:hypothetical protein